MGCKPSKELKTRVDELERENAMLKRQEEADRKER